MLHEQDSDANVSNGPQRLIKVQYIDYILLKNNIFKKNCYRIVLLITPAIENNRQLLSRKNQEKI